MAKANEQVASSACDRLALMEEFRVKGQQVPLRAVHRLCHQVEICPTCASVCVCVCVCVCVSVCVCTRVRARAHAFARAGALHTETHTKMLSLTHSHRACLEAYMYRFLSDPTCIRYVCSRHWLVGFADTQMPDALYLPQNPPRPHSVTRPESLVSLAFRFCFAIVGGARHV